MNRECGPQCTACGAIPRINPKYRYDDDLFATGCQNTALQRGVDRKLMIGESQLAGVGFGLYLGEPVRKGEYLSEYTGEVRLSSYFCKVANNGHRLFPLQKPTVVESSTIENFCHFCLI